MNSIEKYFDGERMQCTVGLLISIGIIALSVYLLFIQKPYLKGMAYAILPLALILSVICIGILLRTPKDIARVQSFYTTGQDKMKTIEWPRMEKVMNNFQVIKKAEIVLFIIGLFMALLYWKNDLVKGIATGLMIQSLILYCFDYFAAARGEAYIQFLKSF